MNTDTSYILHELDGVTGRDSIKFSPIGGLMIRLTNDTGATSVPGQVVIASTSTDYAYDLTGTGAEMPIGIIYDAVADGAEGWIVIYGIADVLLQDNTAGTHGYWVKTSETEAGYANATLAAPPGGGIPELDDHMQEIGHCLQSVSAGGAGTHQTCRIVVHFN